MRIFGRDKKNALSPTPRVLSEMAKAELEKQFGPDSEKAKEDLLAEMAILFPKVLSIQKKTYFEETIRPRWNSLLPPEDMALYTEWSRYFNTDLYEAYLHDFGIFQAWCKSWIENSTYPATMIGKYKSVDQSFIFFIEWVIRSACKKRIEEAGYPSGSNPTIEELELSRQKRVAEFHELFRYDFLEVIDELMKEVATLKGSNCVPAWTFSLPDTLISRLASKHLLLIYDKNIAAHEGIFDDLWAYDYYMFFLTFVSSWLLSVERLQCKVRMENWISQLNPPVRDEWFID